MYFQCIRIQLRINKDVALISVSLKLDLLKRQILILCTLDDFRAFLAVKIDLYRSLDIRKLPRIVQEGRERRDPLVIVPDDHTVIISQLGGIAIKTDRLPDHRIAVNVKLPLRNTSQCQQIAGYVITEKYHAAFLA